MAGGDPGLLPFIFEFPGNILRPLLRGRVGAGCVKWHTSRKSVWKNMQNNAQANNIRTVNPRGLFSERVFFGLLLFFIAYKNLHCAREPEWESLSGCIFFFFLNHYRVGPEGNMLIVNSMM